MKSLSCLNNTSVLIIVQVYYYATIDRLILISKFPYEWIDFFYLFCRNYKFDK